MTWAIVTFADGAVINFGVSYALPARYPTLGQSDRVELLGAEGTMIIDDDHMDHVLYSDRGIPHAYLEFPGEGHGFRGQDAVIRAREASLSFLGQVLGFTPPDVPPLALEGDTR